MEVKRFDIGDRVTPVPNIFNHYGQAGVVVAVDRVSELPRYLVEFENGQAYRYAEWNLERVQTESDYIPIQLDALLEVLNA